MKFCVFTGIFAFISLCGGISLKEAGPPLDLDYYSNLDIDEKELNLDIGDKDPLTLAQLFEGDIDGVTAEDIQRAKKGTRNAIISQSLKWPGAIIPYVYYNGYSKAQKSMIAKAIVRLQEVSCIKMVPRTNQANYVYIYPSGGCSSMVGHQGTGQQLLSLANNCFGIGTILHEMMHAAGFWHEQSRADRDSYVYVYWQNIMKGMAYNFDKYTWNEIQSLGAPYDTCSVMHYNSYAFSANGAPTIVKIQNGGCTLGNKQDYSEWDIRKLNSLYGCDGQPGVTCKDQSTNCEEWAGEGYCKHTHVEFMEKNCCESCKSVGTCEDKDTGCKGWAEEGYCKDPKYEEYMLKDCCLACKNAPVCEDKQEKCASWAGEGYCKNEEYADYMKENCCQSCKSASACNDKEDECSTWASEGYCDYEPSKEYMQDNCCKSCKSAVSCVDKNEDCVGWSGAGYCTDENAAYMKENCCAACKTAACADKNEYCAYWTGKGHCNAEGHIEYMIENCKTSCKLC